MTEAVTLTEAAGLAGVNRRTVRAWIRAGRVPATRTPGGHYRIKLADLAAMPLSTHEFARAVGVSHRTAQAWAKTGKLDARQDAGGAWWIATSEVERIGTRRGSGALTDAPPAQSGIGRNP